MQAGADLTLIALWLGHESLATTHVYLDSDIEHKRQILENTLQVAPAEATYHPEDQLLAFLKDL